MDSEKNLALLLKIMPWIYLWSMVTIGIGLVWIFISQAMHRHKEGWGKPKRKTREEFEKEQAEWDRWKK